MAKPRTTTTTSPCVTCRIYITTTNYLGNFGSAAAADNICASDSNKPATGTYKAMVVDGTRRACSTANCSGGAEGLDWVMRPNTTYTTSAGAALGVTTVGGIFTFPMSNVLDPSGVTVYTGLFMDWTTNASNCVNWTDSTSSARIGNVNSNNSIAISFTTQACNVTRGLICVEQ